MNEQTIPPATLRRAHQLWSDSEAVGVNEQERLLALVLRSRVEADPAQAARLIVQLLRPSGGRPR